MIVYAALVTSAAILLIGYIMAMSSKHLIRLLISLELMFGAVFLALMPLFTIPNLTTSAFSIAVLTVFTSGGELMILIAAMVTFSKKFRSTSVDDIVAGGDSL